MRVSAQLFVPLLLWPGLSVAALGPPFDGAPGGGFNAADGPSSQELSASPAHLSNAVGISGPERLRFHRLVERVEGAWTGSSAVSLMAPAPTGDSRPAAPGDAGDAPRDELKGYGSSWGAGAPQAPLDPGPPSAPPPRRNWALLGTGLGMMGMGLASVILLAGTGVFALSTTASRPTYGSLASDRMLSGAGTVAIVAVALLAVFVVTGSILLWRGSQPLPAEDPPGQGAKPRTRQAPSSPASEEAPVLGRCTESQLAEMKVAGMSESAMRAACVDP